MLATLAQAFHEPVRQRQGTSQATPQTSDFLTAYSHSLHTSLASPENKGLGTFSGVFRFGTRCALTLLETQNPNPTLFLPPIILSPRAASRKERGPLSIQKVLSVSTALESSGGISKYSSRARQGFSRELPPLHQSCIPLRQTQSAFQAGTETGPRTARDTPKLFDVSRR